MKPFSASQLTVDPMIDTPKPSVTIKKYANRRLYNTATSTYVTLETLATMVKDDIEFHVYDAKTSEDITQSVLTQIIMEKESKSGQQNLLPISFLRQLIGFYGENMQGLVPWYLEHSMDMLAKNQEQITSYFQNTFGNMFPFGSAFEQMSKTNMEMFERTMRMFAPFAASDTPASVKDTMMAKDAPAPAPTAEKPKPSSCSIRIDTQETKEQPMATVTSITRKADPVVTKAEPAPAPAPVVVEEPKATITSPTKEPEAKFYMAPPSARAEPDPVPPPMAISPTASIQAPIEIELTSMKAPEPVKAPEPHKAVSAASVTALAEPAPVIKAKAPEPTPAPKPAACSFETASSPSTAAPPAPASVATPTPSPVQPSVMPSAAPTAEDMQAKIANLQRQLAELAKNRA